MTPSEPSLGEHAHLAPNQLVVHAHDGNGVTALVRGTGGTPHAEFLFHATTPVEHLKNCAFVQDCVWRIPPARPVSDLVSPPVFVKMRSARPPGMLAGQPLGMRSARPP